ncbi:MAG: hypothetical protein LAT63_11930 [Marinobacter sp.]|nr:hypothetical protein [Marinobacter sp.]
MRSLAQFVMRGPLQASGVAVIAMAVPLLFWIGAAVVGLVILRLGLTKGLGIALWASLPALGWSMVGGDPSALVVLVSVVIMAAILNVTASWERAILAGCGFALLVGMALPGMFQQLLEQLVAAGISFYQEINPETVQQLGDSFETIVTQAMIASLAGSYLVLSIALTMLARSWQAGLYNPGGFQTEFHRFRLSVPVAAGSLALMFLGPVLGLNPVLVIWVAGVPLLIAGLALVHGVLKARNMGATWVVIFYLALVLLSPSLLLLLVLLAFVDSWLDFRGKVKPADPAE